MRGSQIALIKGLTRSSKSKINAAPPSRKIRQLLLIFFCVILGTVLLAIHLKLFIYPSDDAYIHFRIAEHLLDGRGPYFNSSDPIKTSSSTSWILVIAFVFGLLGRSAVWVAGLNAILLALGGIVFGRLAYLCTGVRTAFWLTCLLYVSISLRASVGLMEVPLCLLLTALGLLCLWHRRAEGFALLAVASFCRPEISLCLLAYFSYCVLRKELPFLKVIFWSAIGALPFLLFDFYFFGTFIPHAIRAKSTVFSVGLFDNIIGFVARALPDRLFALMFPIPIEWTGLFLIIGFVVVAWAMADMRVQTFRGPVFLLPLMVFGLCLGAIYVASGTNLHLWYLPLVISPVVVSVVPIMAKKRPASIVLSIVASLAFGITLIQGLAASAISPIFWPDFEAGARVRKYLEVGALLYRQYPTATLLTSEIGGLGYSFKGAIADGCGLASPWALRYHPLKVSEERSSGKIGAIPPNLAAEMRPELIVTYDVFGEALLRRPEIMSQYTHLVTSFYIAEDMARWQATHFYGGSHLHVLVRKDLKAIQL